MAEGAPVIGFGWPLALLSLLVLVPVALALAYASRRRRAADQAYGGGEALRRGRSPARRRMRAALLFASMTSVALAAGRPTWGEEQVPLTRRGVDLAVALDISRSMTATDIEPTRAEAAAAGLRRMLAALRGDRVGLVTFGGSAFPRSPLSLDLDAVGQLVSQAQGEGLLVEPGTDLADALDASLALLTIDDAAETQIVVLVSDGEHVGGDLEPSIRRARDAGVRVFTVAIGTEDGAPIPEVRGAAAEPTRADRGTLRRIAEQTGGSMRELDGIAGLAVEFSRLRQSTFAGAEETAPVERFQWFLGGALALLLVHALLSEAVPRPPLRASGPRLRTAALATIALVLVACGGTAAYREVHAGNEDHEQARYEDALAHYAAASELTPDDPIIPYNTGNALHELRRYEEASAASRDASVRTRDAGLRAMATYALGNHAFRRGDLEGARAAYVEVLRRDPADEAARHNLELVLLLTRAQQEAQQAGDQADGNEGDQGAEQNPGDGANPGDGTQPGAQPTPGGGAQPGQQPGTDPGGQGGGNDPNLPNQPTPATPPGPGGGPTDTPPTEATPTVEELEAALADALAGLGEEVSLEQALALLDQLRELNSLRPLEGRPRPGGLPDR